jgi:hypothetical protein
MAHRHVGYDWPCRERPRPFPKKILRSAHEMTRVPATSGVRAFLRMTVIVEACLEAFA